MGYSLTEAARASGKSKMTIQRAIKGGKISASRNEDGSYDIDPAELHRMFPAVSGDSPDTDNMGHDDTSSDIKCYSLRLRCGMKKLRFFKPRGSGSARSCKTVSMTCATV
jgi:hypothetical protein